MPDSKIKRSCKSLTRSARVDEALWRIGDLARRFAQKSDDFPTMDAALTQAVNEIEAIRRDLRYERGSTAPVDREARAGQLTMAACKVIDALSLVIDVPKQRR